MPNLRASTAGRTPEVPDPYLGTVWGNILDQYDNPSYNLRLYMIPVAKSSSVSGDAEKKDTADTARSDTPAESDTQTIVVTGRRDIKQVTIAQTGVTGNIIDDLEIVAAKNEKGGFLQQIAKFRVFQPGGANLLDQIAAADIFLGNQVTTTPIMYLDVRFQGYNHDPDDNDQGGEVTTILGPITFKCRLQKIAVKVDNTGSYYDFEVNLENVTAFVDSLYRVPFAITSVGKTITEHVRDFEKQLNKYYADNAANNYERPDEIKFDLSGLIGDGSTAVGFEGGQTVKIKDETLNTSNDLNSEDVNRAWTNETKETLEEEQSGAEEVPKNTGKTDIVVVGDKITIPKGVTFERYFFILLSMNKEFLEMITRKSNMQDPADKAVNAAKVFISWMRMNAEVQELQWDKKRIAYTRRYTYKPTLYNTGRSDVALTIDEVNITGSEAAATVKLQTMYKENKIHKSYYYLFTGRNDQIINMDIAWDGAQVLLVPPNGGVIGDVSITSGVALNSTIAQTADASGKELFSKSKIAGAKAKFGDLLDSIKGNAASIQKIANAIDRPQEQLRTILNDTTGKAQRDLVASLDSRTINKLASSAVMSNTSSSDTAPPTGTTPGGAAYKPETSGFTYSEDLVMSTDAIDVSDLKNFDMANADFRYEVLGTSTVPNIAEAATYVTTSPANTLFGYVHHQHNASAFLNKVNLTLRGDPWYLGKASGETNMAASSTPTSVSYTSDDNFIILQIASAQSYDPDVSDEDSNKNSGFWNFNGMSKSFSGLYRILKVVNNFRNGIYTVDVEATKDIALPLHKVKRVRRDQTPPDLTTVEGYKEASETLGTPASEIGNPTDPGTTTGDPLAPTVGTPPPASKANMAQLKSWLEQNGTIPSENPDLTPGNYNKDAHSSGEHADGRAFDVNIGTGNKEWFNPAQKAKFDSMAAALRSQGWKVVWNSTDHNDHLHVYAPKGK